MRATPVTRCSTEVPLDRFLLLAGPDGDAWLDSLGKLNGVPIEGHGLSHSSVSELEHWLELAGIDADGALLVRPDQHVAWRARSAAPDPAAALSDALRAVLHPESGD